MRQQLLLISFLIASVIAGSRDSFARIPVAAPGQIVIDYVTYYKETNEVTVELFYLKEYTEESAEKMRQAAQETVYDQNEVKRTRVPADLAKTYLDLSGLDQINLFDDEGRFITKARFKGVDYFEDMISACMVAAFTLERTADRDPVFFVSASFAFDPKTPLVLPAGRNKRLRDYIIADVGADTTDQWGFQIKLFQRAANEMYTLVSSGGEAHIYGTLNEDVVSLYKAGNVAILAGLVLNISFNKKPLILLYEGQPESDFMWSNLLYYDGVVYRSTTHNRATPDK